jgi:hypothetical protein
MSAPTPLSFIEITCNGGRIGRIWWENSRESGIYQRGCQPRTWLIPGRWGWDHAWPDRRAWPVMPWGKGDPADEHFRDYVAFEPWFRDQCEKRNLDLDLNITEQIELYAWFCNVFNSGVAAGRDPWAWAESLEHQQEDQP